MGTSSIKLGELVDLVDSGALILPDVERQYNWERGKVVTLMESLYRGHPTGSVVLWETSLDIRHGSSPPAPSRTRPSLGRSLSRRLSAALRLDQQRHIVLDGQKRLIAIYRVLKRDPALRIRFHIDSETFQLESTVLRQDPLWVDVADVLETSTGPMRAFGAVQRGLNMGMGDSRASAFNAALRRLAAVRDHEFPAEVLSSDRFDDVSDTIARINPHGGTRHASELAVARLAFPWPRPLMTIFRDTLEDLEEQHFVVSSPFLMRAISAVAVRSPNLDDVRWVEKLSPEELNTHWRATREGLSKAIAFLKERVGFDSSGMLPNPAILLPLVALFATGRDLTQRDQAGLRYWCIRSLAFGRYAQDVDSVVARDLYAVSTGNPVHGLLHVLESQTGGRRIAPEHLGEAGAWSPLFALSFVLAKSRGAVDWFTGRALRDTRPVGRRRIGACHIFAPALLRPADIPGSRINEIANIAFLSRSAERVIESHSPREYLPGVVERYTADALEAQFVPLNQELWEVNRFNEFLAARRTLLADALNAYLDEIAARPSARAG